MTSLPAIILFNGTCDLCGAEDVSVARFRVEQVKAADQPSVSRTVILCVVCRAPLVTILKSVDRKQYREPPAFAEISDLIETPALRAQRMGQPKPKGAKATRPPRKSPSA